MALFQAQLGTSDTSVFNPSANSAVTTMFICNTHTSAITVTIHLINGSGTPDDTNAILKDLSIPACPSTPPKEPKEPELPKISPVPSWITDSEIEVYSGSDYDYKD